MKARAARGLIVVTFALVCGHFAWRTFGPPTTPDYWIRDERALAGADGEARQVYLRHTLYLAERPRHAWLHVVATDSVTVYVNGRRLGSSANCGFPVAMAVDPAPELQRGTNVIALVVRQTSVGGPPAAAVRGGYVLSDGEHLIGPDDCWRFSHAWQWRAGWWFSREYDDCQWDRARVETRPLVAKVAAAPRATSAACAARWITLPSLEGRTMAARRSFTLTSRPRSAWLRLTANACYRLAINGLVVDRELDALGSTQPAAPARRTYDITQFLDRGDNTVAVLLESPSGTPALLADLEVDDDAGQRHNLGSNERWEVRAEKLDWCRDVTERRTPPSSWAPGRVEEGDLGVPPWEPQRETVALSLPRSLWCQRAGAQATLMAVVALLAWILCQVVQYGLARAGRRTGASRPAGAAYFALVSTAAAAAAAMLLPFDPRVSRQDVFQPRWVAIGLLAVVVQWAWVLVTANRPAGPVIGHRTRPGWRAVATISLVAVIAAAAFWLRVRQIDSRAIQIDEVVQYLAVQGLRDRGFPSIKVDDLPPSYVSTSELVYFVMGAVSLISNDSLIINRLPSVIFGTLTVLLLYLVGRRMFHRDVGLVAAAIAALSPRCIQMSDWGRYPSQLGFMTLLTVYFLWRTIEGVGPVNRRALWLTTLCFIGMYLTWEASSLAALGMIVGALWQRRGRLRGIVCNRAVWLAVAVVLTVVALQYSHRTFQQCGRLWYGTGANEAAITPMWLYPAFEPFYFFWAATWNRDGFLPLMMFLLVLPVTAWHRFREPGRYLTLVFLVTCGLMAFLLPVKAARYGFFLTPLWLLLGSAGMVALGRALWKLGAGVGAPRAWRWHGRAVLGVCSLLLVALASGATAQLTGMTWFVTDEFAPDDLRFPDLSRPCRYLRENLRPGDVVLSSSPQMSDHLAGILSDDDEPRMSRLTDYFLETTLHIQLGITDHDDTVINRYRGTQALTTRESLEEVLARNGRVWYLVMPGLHGQQNSREVSRFLEGHLQVVCEDFSSALLLLDNQHRPAAQRSSDERAMLRADARVLP